MPDTIYQFEVRDLSKKEVSLDQFKGQVLLIVNTASKCGFTPQLKGMTELYRKYKDRGFTILAFPSNDFAGQEPLNGEAIGEFCQLKYEAEYPIFDKIHVKGPEVEPLYNFLTNKAENGKVNSKPRWNFHKYLIDREGRVVDYFMTFTSPMSSKVQKAIEKLL